MSENAARGQLTGSAAEVYDDFFVPALFGQWPPVLLDAVGAAYGDRLLDVGCGTGILARQAVQRVGPGGRVVGLDPNGPMLAVARGRTDQVEWREGSAEDLPFPDGVFERVASQFALMFFGDRARGLAEMARVLVPGGRVVVATWAAVDECPGYAALIEVVERTIGSGTADALRAPFSLGDTSALNDLLAGAFSDIDVSQHPGSARFDSIEAWVHTEIRGWTLADTIDDEQYDRLLAAARADLAPFADSRGRVEFSMPALIGTGLAATT